ncbi:MAG: glycine cleavage system protein GcvH [Porticoccaceae bacterium]|jgi:glycine cleavage system H protein|nr:glycine cleavage system protein GcvH [Porticoccaceae bacterium]MBT3798326.1 glycine cleavage system protein GcvH [Porticoccaceae bacterium]MBT4163893.1 glycine cleavage system protein GcvH [Porticoccaceae bacterium]MBT4211089.1 glycine cleavage system protein GcvH [Porticoccaceae bacterium]MBT5003039.1 glycine cleavage system protein GcvH [Porticoccaceae bacterium]
MGETVYTKDHEWLVIVDGIATIGVTSFAREQLGDVVFVELPEIGALLTKGDEVAVIESVKAAGEINAPINGTVLEVNETLVDEPELLNSSPEEGGWMFKITLDEDSDISGLMNKAEYQNYIAVNA